MVELPASLGQSTFGILLFNQQRGSYHPAIIRRDGPQGVSAVFDTQQFLLAGYHHAGFMNYREAENYLAETCRRLSIVAEFESLANWSGVTDPSTGVSSEQGASVIDGVVPEEERVTMI